MSADNASQQRVVIQRHAQTAIGATKHQKRVCVEMERLALARIPAKVENAYLLLRAAIKHHAQTATHVTQKQKHVNAERAQLVQVRITVKVGNV